MRQRSIVGRVVREVSGDSLEGMEMEVWRPAVPQESLPATATKSSTELPVTLADYWVGCGSTDVDGRFRVVTETDLESDVILLFRAFDEGTLVLAVERRVRWSQDSVDSDELLLEVPEESLPRPPSAPQELTAVAREGEVELRWNDVADADAYVLYWSTRPDVVLEDATAIRNVTSPFVHEGLENGTTYGYVVTAINQAGESPPSNQTRATPQTSDDISIPPLDRTSVGGFAEQSEFLYAGDDPIQKGVDPETIDPTRVAVIRGRVETRDGDPLSGVTVSIPSEPQFGRTETRADGRFDLAVNGGGTLTIRYERNGFYTAQRTVNVPWRDFVQPPEVALVPATGESTTIDPTADEVQLVRGSDVSGTRGDRQTTLLIPPETEVSGVSASPFEVRVQEYTVGPNGPAAMPDELPISSGYTYAVELSIEEPNAGGGSASLGTGRQFDVVRPFLESTNDESIAFDPPIAHYVDNFIGFPVGGIVPAGYYDYEESAWIPSDNGRIIEILDTTGETASIDIAGTGEPATDAELLDLGITTAERRALADLYDPGQQLWRTPIPHFTPWDLNWPFGPPDDATEPGQQRPGDQRPDDGPCHNC